MKVLQKKAKKQKKEVQYNTEFLNPQYPSFEQKQTSPYRIYSDFSKLFTKFQQISRTSSRIHVSKEIIWLDVYLEWLIH